MGSPEQIFTEMYVSVAEIKPKLANIVLKNIGLKRGLKGRVSGAKNGLKRGVLGEHIPVLPPTVCAPQALDMWVPPHGP